MLARLSSQDRDEFVALGRPRRYPPGRVLFGQGDRSNHVVLITSGTVKVFCTTEDGREPLLGMRHEGDLVGELAAIDDTGEVRGATVVARGQVTAQEIGAAEFRSFLETHPAAAMELLRMVVARLRTSDRRRVEFGGYETTARLAHLLAELADDQGAAAGEDVEIPFSQEELGSMVGASRESVARAIVRLRAEGLLETRRRGVALLDVEALRRHGRMS
jgi:CRP/FNR family cyclic AMP-dependent transcriptional regulator